MTRAADTTIPDLRAQAEPEDPTWTCRAIDADGHFIEPESMWKEYLPSAFADVAPRFAPDSMGRRRLVIGNEVLPVLLDETKLRDRSNIRTGTPENAGSDPAVRLAVMDSEGVEAMVMYPTTSLMFVNLSDRDATVALCQAYNNWAAEFCATAPNRLIANAVLPQRWVHETRLEIERAVGQLGCRGVCMRPNDVGRTLEDPAWDPIWSLLEEYDVPLGIHEVTDSYPLMLGSDRTENYVFRHMMSHSYELMAAMLCFIGGGILERHPRLRVAFAEAGCGWVPYWLERMEHHVDEYVIDAGLSLRPTEYFHRQCLVTTDSDEGAVIPAFVSSLGADNLAWSTDFPHPDHEWKGMVGHWMNRSDLNEAAKQEIIGANAARFYRL